LNVAPGTAIPAGVSHTRPNQLCLKIQIEIFLPTVFYLRKLELISEIRSLSADRLPSRIKASTFGVSAASNPEVALYKFLKSSEDYS
jgi:hypothetical protein